MRALTRFYATNESGTESRWFNRGDVVPPEFAAKIGKPGLVDEELETGDGEVLEVPEFPTFNPRGTIEEILAWVGEADDYDERVGRANHALEAEKAGQGRKTLLEALPEFTVE